jgi:radical SAM superfamily enzyme YgiQ (UPF0313 family)
MRVLLTQAYLAGAEIPVYPLGLSCIAATLGEHEVKIYDPNIESAGLNGLELAIRNFKPDILGLSLRNIDSTNKRTVVFYYETFRDMVARISKVLPPGCKTVIGGSGFSMFAEEIFKDLHQIDYGIYREGEITFTQLLQQLDKPDLVPGLFYRDQQGIRFTGSAPQIGPENITLANFTELDPAAYKDFEDGLGIETKRGCNLGCIYCVYSFLNGKKLRLRSPESVVDDVEKLLQRGCKKFTFVDSAFNYPIEHAENICRELLKRQLPVTWSAWFHEKYITDEFVALCLEAGCTKIIFSPDGFSDVTLQRLGKNFKKSDVIRSFNIIRQFDNVHVCYNFFKNPPGNDTLTFIKLICFYFKAKYLLKSRVHFEFNSLRIEPHTKLHELALQEGVVEPANKLLYPVQYTNKKTLYLEKIFDLLIRFKEAVSK